MAGGPDIISESAVAAAPVSELLKAAQVVLTAAYSKITAEGEGLLRERLSQDELIDQAVVAQQVQNSAWAIQSHRFARAADISQHGTDGEAEWFPLEVGARMGWTDRQAGARLGQACDAVESTPGLLDLAGAGGLEPRKVVAVAGITADTPEHVAAQVEARILEGDPEATTSSKLAAKARRLLTRLAPVQADETAQDRRRRLVGVFITAHHEPGLAELTAVLPTLDAAKLMACIDEHARALQQATTTGKTLSQSRVDALTDLVLNGAIVDTQLTLLVPLTEPAPTEPAADVVPTEPAAEAPPIEGQHTQQEDSRQEDSRQEDSDQECSGREHVKHGAEAPARELVGAGIGTPPPSPPPPSSPRPSRSPSSSVVVRRAVPPPGMSLDDWWDYQAGVLNDQEARVEELIAYQHGWWPEGEPPPQLAYDTNLQDTNLQYETGPDGDSRREEHSRREHLNNSAGGGCAGDRVIFDDVLLPRVGVIPGAVIQDLAGVLGIKLSRALANPLTGTITETGDKTYRPGARLAAYVRARDQHCRFPGCTHPAQRCDLDHVIRYPDGPTAAHNLQPLCRHHHRAKHEGGWQVSMTPDGVCTWTSPSGRTYTTQPAD